MANKRVLTQVEIDRYMNNMDELSELSEDGLEYSDDDIDFLPDCVSSIENSDINSGENSSYRKCAWLLYKRVETDQKSENKKNLMNLQKFKSEVALCLCKMGYNQNAKRGRSSNISIEQMFKTKRCKRTAQSVPCKDIRRDGINH
ncbi:hypothetical protein TNIN_158501 [Trichonephila inaurata madagascariensis]|uniref:Uncharacterized protein n=1 Tax=Trichonephila inaurata madagascariensis TaxID=2747483 RepID=A0A8X7CR94_9ARAC|nr:hypothetical protein TNIN_158501 [Trichonephila inaurata madagascariensis]